MFSVYFVLIRAVWPTELVLEINELWYENNLSIIAYVNIGTITMTAINHTSLIYFGSILKQDMIAYVNHVYVSSCNQPVPNNEGKLSCSMRKTLYISNVQGHHTQHWYSYNENMNSLYSKRRVKRNWRNVFFFRIRNWHATILDWQVKTNMYTTQ